MNYFDYSSENVRYPRFTFKRILFRVKKIYLHGNLGTLRKILLYRLITLMEVVVLSICETQMVQMVLRAHLVFMVVVEVQVRAFIRMMNIQRYLFIEC
jgi:hypothetical protein